MFSATGYRISGQLVHADPWCRKSRRGQPVQIAGAALDDGSPWRACPDCGLTLLTGLIDEGAAEGVPAVLTPWQAPLDPRSWQKAKILHAHRFVGMLADHYGWDRAELSDGRLATIGRLGRDARTLLSRDMRALRIAEPAPHSWQATVEVFCKLIDNAPAHNFADRDEWSMTWWAAASAVVTPAAVH